jgi:hypothetical protein
VETAPQVLPVQPGPETLQVTAVLLVLVTVAANCWVPLVFKVAVVGEIATATAGGVLMVTVAEPSFMLSACDVAITRTVFGLGVVAGAV